jgi:hypothetical protein
MAQGFILSEAALYSFLCQDHFPDIIAFAAAIPPHLRQLFLIPIRVEAASSTRISASHVASIPSGDTEESDLFGYQTFVTDDNESMPSGAEPGSIFDLSIPGVTTRHQEDDQDMNVQVPAESSFMSDVDTTEINSYPYRTNEKPVRHSSVAGLRPVLLLRLALKPSFLQEHAPEKVKQRAKTCSVKLVSYDPKNRVFTFDVKSDSGNPRTVRASLSSVEDVAMSCDCPFWQYNGPEFHAVANKFMLGQPFGSASSPDERDPDRKYWLCKHSYAVLRRLDDFVSDVVDENWDLEDGDLLDQIDQSWDEMEEVAEIPLDEAEEEDVDITVEDVEAVPGEDPEEASGADDSSEDLENPDDADPAPPEDGSEDDPDPEAEEESGDDGEEDPDEAPDPESVGAPEEEDDPDPEEDEGVDDVDEDEGPGRSR